MDVPADPRAARAARLRARRRLPRLQRGPRGDRRRAARARRPVRRGDPPRARARAADARRERGAGAAGALPGHRRAARRALRRRRQLRVAARSTTARSTTRPRSAEADELVRGTLAQGPGPYALQAAIASLHTLAPSYAETDWEQIAALYALLERSDPSPVSRSTAPLAVSFAEAPEAALPLLDELAERSADYAPFHAALRRRAAPPRGRDAQRARPTCARSR